MPGNTTTGRQRRHECTRQRTNTLVLSRPSVLLTAGCVAAADNGGDKILSLSFLDAARVLWRFLFPIKFTQSNRLCRTITANSQWEGKVRNSLFSSSSPVTLSSDAKKLTVTLKSVRPCSRYPRAAKFLTTIHTELKKDPDVPRLPNLKVRSAERQRRRSVCPPYRSGTCL
jgi:hypothetical protein